MKTRKLDVLFLQETHINTNTEELHDQYCFIFSACITDQQQEAASKARDMVRAAVGKGKQKGKNNLQLHNLDAERLGVAVVYHKNLSGSKIDAVQHDNRSITPFAQE